MKVLIKAPLSTFSGYGNDGIGMTRAFMRAGADVYLEPTAVQAPLPEDVAMLLTKRLETPFDLFINHVDPMSLEATPEHRRGSKVNVAWTMWESTDFGNMKGTRTLRKRLKDFDAFVGYDFNTINGVDKFYDGDKFVVQGGFEPGDWPEVERDWDEKEFYFCMVGMLSTRKNPFAAVQAFIELQGEDVEFAKHARLSLKTMVPGLHSRMEDAYPNLRIYYQIWTDDVLRQFYASQHVLLAPSRGEGKNMPALEFQSMGGVVVASDFGGHQQWLNSEYNYRIKTELVPVDAQHPTTLQAEVDIEDLKRIMLHLFRNRTEAKEKGRTAARVIPAQNSWDSVLERLMLRLRDVPNGRALRDSWTLLGQEQHGDD
jgi:glycosyltransferase involved in cell wall biosynthesis